MQSYENLFINLFTSGAVSNKPENNLSQTQEKITTSANSKSFNEYLNEVKGSKDSEKENLPVGKEDNKIKADDVKEGEPAEKTEAKEEVSEKNDKDSVKDKKETKDNDKQNLKEKAENNTVKNQDLVLNTAAGVQSVKENTPKETKKELKVNSNNSLSSSLNKEKIDDSLLKDINLELKDTLKENKLESNKDKKIQVTDLRTKNDFKSTLEDKQINPKTDVKMTKDNNATIVLDLNNVNVNKEIVTDSQNLLAKESSATNVISNQIQSAIPDFVKTGSIILKDNDKGSINLVLHPDDIGNVKINLSMDGKTLSGHIIVATKEAMDVFKDNAQTLREAFAKNGFEVGNFDVSYNNNSDGQFQQSDNFFDNNQSFGQKIYNNLENTLAESSNVDFVDNKNNEYFINIVA